MPLDYETTSSYTLTVEARDGDGGTASTTVSIVVSDIAEGPPPRAATFAHDSVTLTWQAPDDPTITGYRISRKRLGQRDLWVHVDTIDVEPNTTYVYRVKAINDAGGRRAFALREGDP